MEKQVISKDDLRQMLTKAYEAGWYGSLELKDRAVEEIIEAHENAESAKEIKDHSQVSETSSFSFTEVTYPYSPWRVATQTIPPSTQTLQGSDTYRSIPSNIELSDFTSAAPRFSIQNQWVGLALSNSPGVSYQGEMLPSTVVNFPASSDQSSDMTFTDS